MAINIYVPGEVQLALAQQITWGTAIADAEAGYDASGTPNRDGFLIMRGENLLITPDVKQRDDKTSRGKRWTDVADFNRDEKGAMPKLSLNIPMVRKNELAFLLQGFFQNVTEGASTPFSKAFTFHATQPDFTANAGCFFTAIHKMPAASLSRKAIDMIIQKLNFKCSPGGVLSVVADFVGRGALTTNSNPSGTWATNADSFFNFEDLTAWSFNIAGAVSPVIGAFEIDLSHDVSPVGQSSGVCQSLGLSNYGGSVKGSVLWNSDTAPVLINAFKAGTACTITIGWGSAGVDGYLNFALYGILDKCDITYGETINVDFSMKIGGSIGGTIEPVTVTLVDTVDRNW